MTSDLLEKPVWGAAMPGRHVSLELPDFDRFVDELVKLRERLHAHNDFPVATLPEWLATLVRNLGVAIALACAYSCGDDSWPLWAHDWRRDHGWNALQDDMP